MRDRARESGKEGHAIVARALFRYRDSNDFGSPSVEAFWYWHRQRILDLVRSALPAATSRELVGVDVGCGDGFVARRIARELKFRTFIAVDAYMDHVRFIAAENDFHGGGTRLEPVLGNIYSVPLRDCIADLVICSEVVEHLTDDARALAELHRILKPGGVLIMATPNGAPLPHRLVWALRGQHNTGSTCSPPLHRDAPDTQLHGHINVQDLSYWCSALRRACFAVEAVRPVTLYYGGSRLDRNPFRFAIALMVQALTSGFPWGHHFSEGLVICARRPKPASGIP